MYVVATGTAVLQAFTSGGPGPAATSSGGEDVYLASFSATGPVPGAAVWITHIGSSANDNLGFVAVDAASGSPIVVSARAAAGSACWRPSGSEWRCVSGSSSLSSQSCVMAASLWQVARTWHGIVCHTSMTWCWQLLCAVVPPAMHLLSLASHMKQ